MALVLTGCTTQVRPEPSSPGTAGSGTAGSGTAGSGTAGSGTAGSGTAGSGTAGSGTAGSGTAGSGTAAGKQVPHSCNGVSYRGVGGSRPAYGARSLRTYPARRYTCKAFWLPHTGQMFTPQSLALGLHRHTAWVAGYKWTPDVADRACRLLRIDLGTGKVLADQGLVVGAPGDRKPTFCRHAGGMSLDRHGLWIAEKERLWLLDPAKVGSVGGKAGENDVLRVWGIRPTVFGSTVLIHHGQIGLGHFRAGPDSGISWFPIDDVLKPGVLDLTSKVVEPGQLARARTARIPGYVQGMTWRRGLLVTRSHQGCGQLVLPGGRAVGVLPGIEAVQFTGHRRVWMLSESSSKAYQPAHGPMVPMLSEYDASKVLALRGPGRC